MGCLIGAHLCHGGIIARIEFHSRVPEVLFGHRNLLLLPVAACQDRHRCDEHTDEEEKPADFHRSTPIEFLQREGENFHKSL